MSFKMYAFEYGTGKDLYGHGRHGGMQVWIYKPLFENEKVVNLFRNAAIRKKGVRSGAMSVDKTNITVDRDDSGVYLVKEIE